MTDESVRRRADALIQRGQRAITQSDDAAAAVSFAAAAKLVERGSDAGDLLARALAGLAGGMNGDQDGDVEGHRLSSNDNETVVEDD